MHIAPKTAARIENRGNTCILKSLNIANYAKVTVVAVKVPDEIITGKHLGEGRLYIAQTKVFETGNEKVIVVLRICFLKALNKKSLPLFMSIRLSFMVDHFFLRFPLTVELGDMKFGLSHNTFFSKNERILYIQL